jgi:hypothetical protein
MRGTRARSAWAAALRVGGELISSVGNQGQPVTDHEHDAGRHTLYEKPGAAAVAQPLRLAGQILTWAKAPISAAMPPASTSAPTSTMSACCVKPESASR